MVPVREEQSTSVPLHPHNGDWCFEAEAYGNASLAALRAHRSGDPSVRIVGADKPGRLGAVVGQVELVRALIGQGSTSDRDRVPRANLGYQLPTRGQPDVALEAHQDAKVHQRDGVSGFGERLTLPAPDRRTPTSRPCAR